MLHFKSLTATLLSSQEQFWHIVALIVEFVTSGKNKKLLEMWSLCVGSQKMNLMSLLHLELIPLEFPEPDLESENQLMALSALTEHWQNRMSLGDIHILSTSNSAAFCVAIKIE